MKVIGYNKTYKDDVYNFVYAAVIKELRSKSIDPEIYLADIRDIEEYYMKNGGRFWVCLNDFNRVIGTIGVTKTDNISGEVRRLYVDESNRRMGVGGKLFDSLNSFALRSKYSKLNVSIDKNAVDAQKFFTDRLFLFVKETRLGNRKYSRELMFFD